MGLPSYMRSVVDRNVVMRRMIVAPVIIILGCRFRWVVSFTSWPLYPPGENAGFHETGGWLDPRAGLDVSAKERSLIYDHWWRNL